MKYNIEINIRTIPVGARTEMNEMAVLYVEAENYSSALERTFTALKSCNSFKEFMDKIGMDTVKYGTS
jgi:hypothetical protein